MSLPSTILAPDRERASAAAWGTLCVLAVAQIVVVAKLSISRNPLDHAAHTPVPVVQPGAVPEIGQLLGAPSANAITTSIAPPVPGSLAPANSAVISTAPPAIGSFQQPGGVRPSPPAVPPLPVNAAPPTLPPLPKSAPVKPDAATELLRDVNYVITTVKEIRGLGDMNGALEMLRRADELTPDHPAIIAETAQTYEQMGVTAKATDNWRRIQLLGETKAGNYFELASRRLGAGPAAAASVPSIEGDKVLRLGACLAKRDFSTGSGERYTVRVPLVRAGSQPVDNNAVNLQVFFFDRVNGTKIAQTIAPEPIEAWQTAPVDWNGGTGEETLDVTYHLPVLTAAEVQQHGRRSYYGYMLRLYYNNKLQDVAAEPRDLLGFGSTPGAPAGVNPLLPPAGR